ncbi:MAG: ELM1/GtrOC1 family putative glycosyltransferase [Candidatus Omnitrophota bacterium]
MNSFQGSIASGILKIFAAVIRLLPLGIALCLGRCIGDIACAASVRQRRLVMRHLKTAFGKTRTYAEICMIMREFYRCYGQSIIELARLPLIARHGFAACVDVQGREHVDAAIKKGKGCIFLSIHAGNWELSNMIGSMIGYPYNMVANDLNNINKVAEFINNLRRSAGCRIIHPGIGGREIIRRLQKNEIVTLVADQGGSDGLMVPFFGRQASMSTGAVRIALKYDVPVILVNIHRSSAGRHSLTAVPFDLKSTQHAEEDIKENLRRMMRQYEAWVNENPQEYVWFYKTWKYDKSRTVLILDDGRVGHLRQSQAAARAYAAVAFENGLSVFTETVKVDFKTEFAVKFFPFAFLYGGAWGGALKRFIEPLTWEALSRVRPDAVISCGARNAAVNAWVSRENGARSIVILRPGPLRAGIFSLLILPQHDLKPGRISSNVTVTKGALNLMDKVYLEDNVKALILRYQHLRQNQRPKLALLIGGDTKGVVMSEHQIKGVLRQVKSAATEFGIDLLVSTSRRTTPVVEQAVIRELSDYSRTALIIIASKTNVPEAVGGMLGLADIVVVSGESISMISEASASGKKTIVFSVGASKDSKYSCFCEKLAEQGHIYYTEPLGIAGVIDTILRNKVVMKAINDNGILKDAMRRILP